jgi:hypothetical protein
VFDLCLERERMRLSIEKEKIKYVFFKKFNINGVIYYIFII